MYRVIQIDQMLLQFVTLKNCSSDLNKDIKEITFSTTMQNTLQRKRTDFAVSIRKEQRTKIIQAKRIKYFNLLPQQIDQQDFIQHFQLKNNPKFSPQQFQKNQFILVSILLAKSQNFIKKSFKNNQISSRVDEKLYPSPESQFEVQEVPLPKQYPFRLQTALYDSISSDIYQNPGKYKNLQKNIQSQLINYWINFLQRNKYTETARQKQYHLSIINLLQLLVLEIQSPNLREKIFSWVEGPQSLTLIFNCLPGQFMNCHKYSKIYDIILKGFKHKSVQKRIQSVDVMLKCIRMSDYDDIVALLKYKPKLFSALLVFFQDKQILNGIYENSEYLNSMRKAGFCLNLFLQTYDEYIFQCLRQGAGYIGALLICEKDPDLIKQGLQIFEIMANIQQKKYSREAFKFLIYNPSIVGTGVWNKLGRSYQIVRNQDLKIRNQFVQFIHIFFANAEFHEIVSLSCQFQFPNQETLIDIMIQMFLENDDELMLINILGSFQSLFYYYQKYVDDIMEMDEWENQHVNHPVQTISVNVIVSKIQLTGMIKKLQQIQTCHQNSELVSQQLKTQVSTMLQFLSQFDSL